MQRIFFRSCYFGILLLMISASTYAQQNYNPPGKLVDAGGHLLHLNVQGKGSPTVIFENGSGDFSFIWSLVQPSIAQITTTVSYDRAGFAWSEPGPHPRSSRQIAFELHEALQHAGTKPPYIMVGQSFGGFLVRAFTRFYPGEVAGMVLVEALHENSQVVFGGGPHRIREMSKGLKAPAPQKGRAPDSILALQKKMPPKLDTALEFPLNKLPQQAQQWQLWAQANPVFQQEASAEMEWSPEDVADMYKHINSDAYKLRSIPLIVLTRGSGGYDGMKDSAALENERVSLQAALAKLSTNSKHITDKNSGHNIHLEDPDLVIASIKEVIAAVVHHSKL